MCLAWLQSHVDEHFLNAGGKPLEGAAQYLVERTLERVAFQQFNGCSVADIQKVRALGVCSERAHRVEFVHETFNWVVSDDIVGYVASLSLCACTFYGVEQNKTKQNKTKQNNQRKRNIVLWFLINSAPAS